MEEERKRWEHGGGRIWCWARQSPWLELEFQRWREKIVGERKGRREENEMNFFIILFFYLFLKIK
jgi:hypothetical protein